MIGNNELHINTATLVEAVQMWLDSKMPLGAPTVTTVKPSRSDSMFVVDLSSEADRPGARGMEAKNKA